MTKPKALKDFIKRFLNYDATGNSVISVLNDTTANAEGGGGEGGSIGCMRINVDPHYDETETGGELIDHTFAEIRSAYSSGQPIYVRFSTDAGQLKRILYLSEENMDSPNSFTFRGSYEKMTDGNVTGIEYVVVKVDENDNVTITYPQMTR